MTQLLNFVQDLLERRFVEFGGKAIELRRLETAASRPPRNQQGNLNGGFQRGAPNGNGNGNVNAQQNWAPNAAYGMPNWSVAASNNAYAASPSYNASNGNWNGQQAAQQQQQPQQYAYWNGQRLPQAAMYGTAAQTSGWTWPAAAMSNGTWQSAAGQTQVVQGAVRYSNAAGTTVQQQTAAWSLPAGYTQSFANASVAANGAARPAGVRHGGPAQNGFGFQTR